MPFPGRTEGMTQDFTVFHFPLRAADLWRLRVDSCTTESSAESC